MKTFFIVMAISLFPSALARAAERSEAAATLSSILSAFRACEKKCAELDGVTVTVRSDLEGVTLPDDAREFLADVKAVNHGKPDIFLKEAKLLPSDFLHFLVRTADGSWVAILGVDPDGESYKKIRALKLKAGGKSAFKVDAPSPAVVAQLWDDVPAILKVVLERNKAAREGLLSRVEMNNEGGVTKFVFFQGSRKSEFCGAFERDFEDPSAPGVAAAFENCDDY